MNKKRLNAEKEESINLLAKNDETIIELTKERDSLSLKIEDLIEQLRIKEESSSQELEKLQNDLNKTKVLFTITYFYKLYKKTQASINEKDSTLERLHDELDNAQKKLQTSEIEAKDKALAEKGTSIEINIRFSYF